MLNFSFQRVLKVILLSFIVHHYPLRVTALNDDWYGYVTFSDVKVWGTTYPRLCLRTDYDYYREPRLQSRAEDLRALREAISPVIIDDEETVKAPEKVTLHIYNNGGVRRGFSVSYGFQKNKECLHGSDPDCIVFPQFGHVRALVLNAERYREGQNLNYIKDHFQIEDPERFVTITNGGSNFERKFYEAIFLGGLKNRGDPRRSSHQINGVSYPMEIYMFFVDETVPSVSLSTVLVVLVEESERDNEHIKPIVTTVGNKLYDEERRFLNRNKFFVRRERLFHHLGLSTKFDIYTRDKENNILKKPKPAKQLTLEPSRTHEPAFSANVEAFEKMQALEATLFFIDEDFENVKHAFLENKEIVDDIYTRNGNFFFPYDPEQSVGGGAGPIITDKSHELHVMAISAQMWPIRSMKLPKTCQDCLCACKFMIYKNTSTNSNGYFDVTRRPDPKVDWNWGNTVLPAEGSAHFDRFFQLTVDVCKFLEKYMEIQRQNRNNNLMRRLHYFGSKDAGVVTPGKYDLVKQYTDLRKEHEEMNKRVYDHFFDDVDHKKDDVNNWNWKDDHQKHSFVTNLMIFLGYKDKFEGYIKVRSELDEKIDSEVDRLHFPNEKTMREVIHFLKFGDKGHTETYRRDRLHEQFTSNKLPAQEKRRGFVELGNMGMSEEEIKESKVLSPIKITVDQMFQISWLIPHDGGYYYYEGSSPVPPCFRVQNTIVFKRPIKMSKYQIDVLTRIPSSFKKERDILNTAPIIQDVSFSTNLNSEFSHGVRVEEVIVKVYNQSRNHLFLGHDGVHKNAVEEHELLKTSSGGGRLYWRDGGNIIVLLVVIAAFQNVYKF